MSPGRSLAKANQSPVVQHPTCAGVSTGAAGPIGISSAYLAAGLRFALRAGFAQTARRH